ncbi:MAG: 50S ribosomal protein L14 [Bacilli bacterium]|nr:50S ribosomal protein L14 [Bacilli bacterium]
MIQKGTVIKVADNSGAQLVRVYQIYVGSKHRYAEIGDIVGGSVTSSIAGGKVKKSDKVKLVIIRVKKNFLRSDGSFISFNENAGVIIDNNNEPVGNRVFGPVARELQKKFSKIVSSAECVY